MGKVEKIMNVSRRPRREGEVFSRKFAIRNHCLQCAGGNQKEVRECGIVDCHLWPYRMGGGVDVEEPEGAFERESVVFRAEQAQG